MFGERLASLARRVDGTLALALVGRDGMQVESWPESPPVDLESLCAEVIAQLRSLADGHRELDVGRVEQFSIVTDRCTILASALTDEYYLLLVLAGEGSFGRARFELRRARLRFGRDLV